MKRSSSAAFALAALAVAACGLRSEIPTNTANAIHARPSISGAKIRHIVIVIQENRSFDNLFATFPHADGTLTGRMHDGTVIPLRRTPLVIPRDLCHEHLCWSIEYDNGKMDGFDKAYFALSSTPPMGTFPYRYVNPADIRPYWTMAKQYALADHMFETQGGGSFASHQVLIAGGTTVNRNESVIDAPWNGEWGCDAAPGTTTPVVTIKGKYLFFGGPFPCFSWSTMRDLLDDAGVDWRYYSPDLASTGSLWSAFAAIRAVRYGPEWKKNVVAPETTIFSDLKNHKLAGVSGIVPDWANSDHPGGPDDGPDWVASIVNAIGESYAWNSTAIVVVWDDWGGLYDHVPPPQLDYDSLGFRVPMIVVSPYARHGYISHTQYEFGSILKFVEDNWSLARLGTSDVRANGIENVFDFTQAPRAFTPIQSNYPALHFIHEKPSHHPVDTE